MYQASADMAVSGYRFLPRAIRATVWQLERAEERDPLLETELETQNNKDGQHVGSPEFRRSLSTLLIDEKRSDKEKSQTCKSVGHKHLACIQWMR